VGKSSQVSAASSSDAAAIAPGNMYVSVIAVRPHPKDTDENGADETRFGKRRVGIGE
jgi:hypothetical protein